MASTVPSNSLPPLWYATLHEVYIGNIEVLQIDLLSDIAPLLRDNTDLSLAKVFGLF